MLAVLPLSAFCLCSLQQLMLHVENNRKLKLHQVKAENTPKSFVSARKNEALLSIS